MAEPAVVATMRRHREAVLSREQAQIDALTRRWAAVERSLRDKMELLAADVAERKANGETVATWRLVQLARYQDLLKQANTEVRAFTGDVGPLIQAEQLALAEMGIEHAQEAIQESASLPISYTRLPVEATRHMIGLAGDGSPLTALLRQAYPDAVEGMTQALISGVAQGWNPRRTAKAMADGSAAGLQRALVIARTEQLRVYRQASLDQYRASGVVEGWKRLAAKDSRACVACLMSDGRIYPLAENFDAHPVCRCTSVPIVTGMPVLQWETGRDWFTQQSERTQREILGAGRFSAWQAGRFDLGQLVSVKSDPTWGNSLVPTPLSELVA